LIGILGFVVSLESNGERKRMDNGGCRAKSEVKILIRSLEFIMKDIRLLKRKIQGKMLDLRVRVT
jgi:hypothetical protein